MTKWVLASKEDEQGPGAGTEAGLGCSSFHRHSQCCREERDPWTRKRSMRDVSLPNSGRTKIDSSVEGEIAADLELSAEGSRQQKPE